MLLREATAKHFFNFCGVFKRRRHDKTGTPVAIAVIQEAGLDGFWIHRLLVENGIESHVALTPSERQRASD